MHANTKYGICFPFSSSCIHKGLGPNYSSENLRCLLLVLEDLPLVLRRGLICFGGFIAGLDRGITIGWYPDAARWLWGRLQRISDAFC